VIVEIIAAVLVALAVVTLIIGPLLGGGHATSIGADEPEDLEETPKGMALAALREIEFDRATGKLSEEDFAELKAKYTAEALEVLRREAPTPVAPVPAPAGTAGLPASDPVEAMIAERVRTLAGGQVRCPTCGPRPEGDALFCSTCGRSLTVGGCGSCGAPLVPGSRFCENCGTAVAA